VTVGEEKLLCFSVLTRRTTKTTSTFSTATDGEDGGTGHELNEHSYIWVYGSDPVDAILRFHWLFILLGSRLSDCMKTTVLTPWNRIVFLEAYSRSLAKFPAFYGTIGTLENSQVPGSYPGAHGSVAG
jgi:hypothetical protein